MKKTRVGAHIIASAVIWGAVILGCSMRLRGTECYDTIHLVLYAGVLGHLLFVWAPMGVRKRKANKDV